MHQLAPPQLQTQIQEKKIATTQDKSRLFRIKSLQIHLPQTCEQAEIVRRVETLFAFADRLKARLEPAQTTTTHLTPALLAKAFRGELVPQDPNDKPAVAMLERILAAGKNPPTPKGKGPRGRPRQGMQ